MTEEYQESEVVFQDKISGKETRYPKIIDKKRKPDKKKPNKKGTSSVPIRIQEEFSGSSWFHQYLQTHSFDDDNDYINNNEDVEIVPPHVILERRVAGKAAFSVCSGNGRTLKGRDLRQVRDSILRMTGFLES